MQSHNLQGLTLHAGGLLFFVVLRVKSKTKERTSQHLTVLWHLFLCERSDACFLLLLAFSGGPQRWAEKCVFRARSKFWRRDHWSITFMSTGSFSDLYFVSGDTGFRKLRGPSGVPCLTGLNHAAGESQIKFGCVRSVTRMHSFIGTESCNREEER